MASPRLYCLIASLLFLIGGLGNTAMATVQADSKAYAGVESLDKPSNNQGAYFQNNDQYVNSILSSIRKQGEYPAKEVVQLTTPAPFLLLYLLRNVTVFKTHINERQSSTLFPFHVFW